ncbi:MAG TPA: hypothetical protein VFZ44_20565 [Pyrinomonadaceae bacterium]
MSATLLALLLAALTLTSTQSKGINPVQHSEGATAPATTTSKGINPVQHSE